MYVVGLGLVKVFKALIGLESGALWPLSDVYVRNFFCPFSHNKTSATQNSEWSSLVPDPIAGIFFEAHGSNIVHCELSAVDTDIKGNLSGAAPPRLNSLNCNRKHLGRGAAMTFTEVNIHPQTPNCVKGKEEKENYWGTGRKLGKYMSIGTCTVSHNSKTWWSRANAGGCLNYSRKPWERCVLRAFRDFDSHPSTATFVKGKKRMEILGYRTEVA